MEERIEQLEAEAERLIARLEEEARRLLSEVTALRQQWDASQERDHLRSENEQLRARCGQLQEAVVRYALACAQVDVQVAMMRARGESRDGVIENLRKSMDEEAAASQALRDLAKELQGGPQEEAGEEPVAAIAPS